MKNLVKSVGVGIAALAITVVSSVMAVSPAQAATRWKTPTIHVDTTICIGGIKHTSTEGPYGTTINTSLGIPC